VPLPPLGGEEGGGEGAGAGDGVPGGGGGGLAPEGCDGAERRVGFSIDCT